MELTGVIAQVFMVWWTRQLQQKKRDEDITTHLYKRYIDDIVFLYETLEVIDNRKSQLK